MNDENNTGNKPTNRKIAAAGIIGTFGSGLMVTTVVKLFEAETKTLPWWWPYTLTIGSMLFIAALLLLVPPEWLRKIQYSPSRLRTWIWEEYIWLRYKPKIVIDGPIFTSEVSPIGQDYYEAKITANIGVNIKNPIRTVKVNLSAPGACLEQSVGLEQQKRLFLLQQLHEVCSERVFQPQRDWQEKIPIVFNGLFPDKRENLPDLQKDYNWGLRGIYVTLLPSGVRRQIRKGIKL